MEISADNKKVFVDTNILIYANVTNSLFHSRAKSKLIELVQENNQLYISNQIIREYLSVLSRPDANGKRIANELLMNDINRLRTEYHVIYENSQTIDNLQTLFSTFSIGGKQIHDANIVATMLTNDIKLLLTHNIEDFKRFNEIISTLTI